MDDVKTITIRLRHDLHNDVKVLLVKKNASFQSVVVGFLENLRNAKEITAKKVKARK